MLLDKLCVFVPPFDERFDFYVERIHDLLSFIGQRTYMVKFNCRWDVVGVEMSRKR